MATNNDKAIATGAHQKKRFTGRQLTAMILTLIGCLAAPPTAVFAASAIDNISINDSQYFPVSKAGVRSVGAVSVADTALPRSYFGVATFSGTGVKNLSGGFHGYHAALTSLTIANGGLQRAVISVDVDCTLYYAHTKVVVRHVGIFEAAPNVTTTIPLSAAVDWQDVAQPHDSCNAGFSVEVNSLTDPLGDLDVVATGMDS